MIRHAEELHDIADFALTNDLKEPDYFIFKKSPQEFASLGIFGIIPLHGIKTLAEMDVQPSLSYWR